MVKEFINEFGKTYCRVSHLAEYRSMVVAWHGYTTKLQVETVLLWLEEREKEVPYDAIINDCTEILSVWGDSIGWLSRIWALRMTRIGLRKFVHVAKVNSFGYRIGTELEQSLISQVELKYFGSRSEAFEWLSGDKASCT